MLPAMFPRSAGKLERRCQCKQPSRGCLQFNNFPGRFRLFVFAFTHFHLKKNHVHACANGIFLFLVLLSTPSRCLCVIVHRRAHRRRRTESWTWPPLIRASAACKSLFQKWFALSILNILLASRLIIYLSYLSFKKMLDFVLLFPWYPLHWQRDIRQVDLDELTSQKNQTTHDVSFSREVNWPFWFFTSILTKNSWLAPRCKGLHWKNVKKTLATLATENLTGACLALAICTFPA